MNSPVRFISQSDLLVVLPIYAAGEQKNKWRRRAMRCLKESGVMVHKEVVYFQDFETAVSHLIKILNPEDILLTLGAGDVWKVGEMVLKEL